MYKYRRIYEDLLNKILNKEYKDGERIPSEEKLCEQYGVSRVTVNNAVSKLQKRGYLDRRVGDGSYVRFAGKEEKQKFVSFIMLSNQPENNEIVAGISDVLGRNNIKLTVSVSHDDAANEERILRQLEDSDISGIICYPYLDAKNNVWGAKNDKNVPIVFLDRYPEKSLYSSVQANSYDGMYDMTEYVIEAGHTDIAYFTMPLSPLMTMKERFDGFRDCMNAHGLPCKNGYISVLPPQLRPYTEDDFMPNIIALLTRADRPSVIVCANDVLALNCIRTAQTLGLRVPEGISVTGFDDTYHSAHSTPPLTTMRQPFYAMGQTAAEMLCDRIANGRRVISKVYLETKLIERESVLRLR